MLPYDPPTHTSPPALPHRTPLHGVLRRRLTLAGFIELSEVAFLDLYDEGISPVAWLMNLWYSAAITSMRRSNSGTHLRSDVSWIGLPDSPGKLPIGQTHWPVSGSV